MSPFLLLTFSDLNPISSHKITKAVTKRFFFLLTFVIYPFFGEKKLVLVVFQKTLFTTFEAFFRKFCEEKLNQLCTRL